MNHLKTDVLAFIASGLSASTAFNNWLVDSFGLVDWIRLFLSIVAFSVVFLCREFQNRQKLIKGVLETAAFFVLGTVGLQFRVLAPVIVLIVIGAYCVRLDLFAPNNR